MKTSEVATYVSIMLKKFTSSSLVFLILDRVMTQKVGRKPSIAETMPDIPEDDRMFGTNLGYHVETTIELNIGKVTDVK
jgi:hypothetical protein